MLCKRHNNPNRAEHNRKASARRDVIRKSANVLYLRNLIREKEIGVDPKYDHARGRNETERFELRAAWLKQAEQWDKEHTA